MSSSPRTASIPSFGRRVSSFSSGLLGLRRLPRARAARAHSALANRPLADVARQGKALPRPSPCAPGNVINYVGFVPADEEMKESWSAPGDPDVLRREFAGWDPRIEQLLGEVRHDVPLGAVRPRAAADLDQGPADPARRCRASDAAASRTRREPVDRGWNGACDDPRARERRLRPPRCSPTRGCAANASRRFSAARARTACATTPPTRILACGTPKSPRMPRFGGGSTIMSRAAGTGTGRDVEIRHAGWS